MSELIVRFTRLTNDRHRFAFVRPDGSTFEARIAEFALTQPNALN